MNSSAPLVVVMGVSGCGKSTVGRLLARRLGADYLEGDELHPPRNIERMAAGEALTDADRAEWLGSIAARLGAARDAGRGLVATCSALKRSYRDRLREGAAGLAFVHLHGSRALLDGRMRARAGHFMPASLLESQLRTLEAPAADERALNLDVALPASVLVERAAGWLAEADPPAVATPSAKTSAASAAPSATSTLAVPAALAPLSQPHATP